MAEQFDIAIIGAGPGGYSAALRAAELGQHVVLIERDATLGGTCLNRGCIPSKALITAARTIDDVHRGERMGIVAQVDAIDFATLGQFRDTTVADMVTGLRTLIAARGITVYQGVGSLQPDHTVIVTPSLGLDQVRTYTASTYEDVAPVVVIEATDVILATGSSPRPLPNHEFHGSLLDSTGALFLDEFPKTAAIIGSGAVALEFASMWRAAGCEVTLFIRNKQVISHNERRASMALTREFKRQGITIVPQSHITHVEADDPDHATVHYQIAGDEIEHTCQAQVALVAIGRVPNTVDDWWDTCDIARDEHGMVLIDSYGRTNKAHVWALGDITPGALLAHRAFAQGYVIAETIAGLYPEPVQEEYIPNVIFSTPEFASVGLTSQEAKTSERFTNIEETILPVMANARMVMSGMGGSFSLVSGTPVDGDEPIVLGVHIVAPDASDLIAEAQQLVAQHIPLHQAANQIHPHPTLSEMMGEALLHADHRPLHTK